MSLDESNYNKAKDLFQQGTSVISRLIYLGDRYGDALDLFQKATNLFKLTQHYEDAIKSLEKTIICLENEKNQLEIANVYLEISNCYKMTNDSQFNQQIIANTTKAVQILCEEGRFSRAAKEETELSKFLEESEELEEACKHYEKAIQYSESSQLKTTALECLGKLAEIQGTLEKYKEAIDSFEKAAQIVVSDNLGKWKTREYLMKAFICFLMWQLKTNLENNVDMLDGDNLTGFTAFDEMEEKLKEYKELDMFFVDSLECQLMEQMIGAIKTRSIKEFTIALRNFDKLKRLDTWKTNLFLRIKDAIKEIDLSGLC
ncbi:hypothetical protein ABK040_015516 [Willaertia magna]